MARPRRCYHRFVTAKAIIRARKPVAIMEESDSNPAWRPGVPFRFPKLPTEVRILVYKQLFRGMFLTAGKRCHCLGYAKTIPGDEGHELIPDYKGDDFFPGGEHEITKARIFEPGRLPNILTVSKTVRDEALPVFAKSITLFFHNTYDEQVQRVPKVYLASARSAIIQSACDIRVDKTLMPNLRTLHIFLGLDVPIFHENDFEEKIPSNKDISSAIIKEFKDEYRENLEGIYEFLNEGNPSFRILISYESGIFHNNPNWTRDLVCAQSVNDAVNLSR